MVISILFWNIPDTQVAICKVCYKESWATSIDKNLFLIKMADGYAVWSVNGYSSELCFRSFTHIFTYLLLSTYFVF